MRRVLLSSVVVCLWALPVQAGVAWLTWDYPVAWQEKVTFVAHIVQNRQGQVTVRDETLALTWTGGTTTPGSAFDDICAQFMPGEIARIGIPLTQFFTTDIGGRTRPMDGTPWMAGACEGRGTVQKGRTTCGDFPDLATKPEVMCAQICLEPGVYTVTVRATATGFPPATSVDQLDLDLRASDSCQPKTPPPPPPPQEKPKTPFVDKLPPIPPPPIPLPDMTPTVSLATSYNPGCVDWKVTGVCACGFPPHPCATVEYSEPAYLIEVVPRPGTTMIPGASQILGSVLGKLGLWGGGGAANTTGQGHTSIHYSEVHVWNFPQVLGGPCTQCAPRTIPLALHYASELDAVGWRTSVAINNPINTALQIGVWARLYPRQGKVIHGSPVIAAAVDAVRALDISYQPIGNPPNVDTHVVTAPIPGASGLSLTTCMQMAWPRPSPCQMVGTPPPLWETGAVDARGNYLWTVWQKRTCCVDFATMTCGITLPGVGAHGQNICPLTPPTP